MGALRWTWERRLFWIDRRRLCRFDSCAERLANDVSNGSVALTRQPVERGSIVVRQSDAELRFQRLRVTGTYRVRMHGNTLAERNTRDQDKKRTGSASVEAESTTTRSYGHEDGLRVFFVYVGDDLDRPSPAEVATELTRPLELRKVWAGLPVDEWMIGRELVREHGAWHPARPCWERVSPSHRNEPTAAQVRRGSIEPHLIEIGRLLEDVFRRQMHPYFPDWARQMGPWKLEKPRSARGQKRTFDSAAIAKDQEGMDSEIARELNVSEGAIWKRRQRDRSRHLPEPPSQD